MHLLKRTLSVIISLCATVSFAQTSLPIPANIQAAYNKGTRTTGGAPGKNYWQNHAAYNLTINFTPKTRVLDGVDEIEYTNNSPDTLKQIWFKLYPNLYQKGNIRAMPIKPEDITDGARINKIEINQTVYDTSKLIVNGTNMIIPNEVVSPKQSVHFKIYYS